MVRIESQARAAVLWIDFANNDQQFSLQIELMMRLSAPFKMTNILIYHQIPCKLLPPSVSSRTHFT